jgi:hypothetical protein
MALQLRELALKRQRNAAALAATTTATLLEAAGGVRPPTPTRTTQIGSQDSGSPLTVANVISDSSTDAGVTSANTVRRSPRTQAKVMTGSKDEDVGTRASARARRQRK